MTDNGEDSNDTVPDGSATDGRADDETQPDLPIDPVRLGQIADEAAVGGNPTPWESLRAHPRFTAMVIAALAVATVLAGAIAFSVGSNSPPTKAADRFLSELQVRNYDNAQALTDPVCSNGATAALLSGVFGGADFEYELKESDVASASAQVQGTVDIDGVPNRLRLTLRNVDGDWRVCSVGTY